MKNLLIPLALCLSQTAWAETPAQFIASYSAEAGGGFSADAARGKAFANRNWGVSEKLPTCVACHTQDPRNPGRHAVTGKNIKPLSPIANPARFTDAAKVEKWFKRNCKEVVGRECSAGEKADFIQFILSVR